MRDNSDGWTIERNYLQKWRFLIPEYEAVKAGAIRNLRCSWFDGIRRKMRVPRSRPNQCLSRQFSSPSLRRRTRRYFPVFRLVDYSITIGPIKYIRILFSFYCFKPNRNVINNHRMPSKPSLPFCSIFGS